MYLKINRNIILQLGWVTDVNKRNLADELARGVAEAEVLLQAHSERKVTKYYLPFSAKYALFKCFVT